MRVTCLDSEIGTRIAHPAHAAALFLPMMLEDRETLVAMFLDSSRRVMHARRIAIGTIDSVTCEPRLVFRPAVTLDASAILIAHNHPSGNVTPSIPDIETTRMLEMCAKVLGILFVDHLVLARDGRFQSIAEYMETRAVSSAARCHGLIW